MELIEPKRTVSEDTEDTDSQDGFFGHGGFPIIIIRTQSTPEGQDTETPPFRPPFFSSGFPFLPPPFLNPARNDEVDPEQPLPGFENPLFDTFFGPPPPNSEDEEVIPEERCGILCMMLKNLDAEIKRVREEVHEMKRRKQEEENEIDSDDQDNEDEDNDQGFDVHNSTYTEEVIKSDPKNYANKIGKIGKILCI